MPVEGRAAHREVSRTLEQYLLAVGDAEELDIWTDDDGMHVQVRRPWTDPHRDGPSSAGDADARGVLHTDAGARS